MRARRSGFTSSDRAEVDNLFLGEERDRLDFEVQHRFRATARHELMWGAGHRQSRDDIRSSSLITIAPAKRTPQWANVHAPDSIALVPVGTMLEDNEYTGSEWQPSARVADTLDVKRAYWASASSAVSTPSLGIGWHARRSLKLSLVGQNLLDSHHPEHSLAVEAQRGVYGKLTGRF